MHNKLSLFTNAHKHRHRRPKREPDDLRFKSLHGNEASGGPDVCLRVRLCVRWRSNGCSVPRQAWERSVSGGSGALKVQVRSVTYSGSLGPAEPPFCLPLAADPAATPAWLGSTIQKIKKAPLPFTAYRQSTKRRSICSTY